MNFSTDSLAEMEVYRCQFEDRVQSIFKQPNSASTGGRAMYRNFCKMKMVVSLKMVSAHFQTTHWYFFRRAKHEAPLSVLSNCAVLS